MFLPRASFLLNQALLFISFLLFASIAGADDGPNQVTVGQDVWGFLNPVAPRYVPDPKLSQSFKIGEEMTIGFISPFKSTRVIMQSPDSNTTKVVSDSAQGNELKWTLSIDGFPGTAYRFLFNMTAVDSNDKHAGLAMVSSQFDVIFPRTNIFGPLGSFTIGSIVAMLFGAVVLVILVFSGCSMLMKKGSKSRAGDRSSAAYTPLMKV